jgi:hypothetical protein
MKLLYDLQRIAFTLSLLLGQTRTVHCQAEASVTPWPRLIKPHPQEQLFPPLLPHCSGTRDFTVNKRHRIYERDPLLKARDFECPSGTYSCTNAPDLCCAVDETCVLITGAVGCCPNGQTCGGQIGSCIPGYTSCSFGGCCSTGFDCASSGCISYSKYTATTS